MKVGEAFEKAIKEKDTQLLQKILNFYRQAGISSDKIYEMAFDSTSISKSDWNELLKLCQ